MEIRNIWAVGRNYQEHAKELGNSVPKDPMIFLKAGSCITLEDSEIELPSFSKDIHHEIEVAVQLDQRLQASRMTLAIDFTARDIQNQLKAAGHPWTLAKSFKHACALGKWVEHSEFGNLNFSLKVNGEVRQRGNTKDMVFNVETLVEYIKKHFPVVPGDIILTGTPSGVARVQPGDVLEAEIPGKINAKWSIKRA